VTFSNLFFSKRNLLSSVAVDAEQSAQTRSLRFFVTLVIEQATMDRRSALGVIALVAVGAVALVAITGGVDGGPGLSQVR
jgi:hypothetical protein